MNYYSIKIDIPNYSEFPDFKMTQENLVNLTKLRKYYVYKLLKKLRFPVRCSELAFCKHGFKNDSERFYFTG